MDLEQSGELDEIGLDRRLHVRILQLASKRASVMACGAMHLAERSRRRRLVLERGEFRFPIGAKLCRHAPPHERPAHGRGVALKLAELCCIFGRQRFGDRGEELRHLHDRALQPAKRGGERRGVPVALGIEAEEPPCHDPGRDRADIGADPAIAERAGAEAVLLQVGRAVVHRDLTRNVHSPNI